MAYLDVLADCGLPAAQLRATAIAITALVDGLWLELCLSPHELAADEAAAIARADPADVVIQRADPQAARGRDSEAQYRPIFEQQPAPPHRA